jgi:serine protease Do
MAALELASRLIGPTAIRAAAEEPTGLQAAEAIQQAVENAIAKSEHSVVAIAQSRKYKPGKAPSRGFRPDPFMPELQPVEGADPQPKDADFIPTEYGTGVVVDRRGLILTNFHVLGKSTDDFDVEHWVATADHKNRLATIKAADPRSDLAILEIDATNLTPITFGDGAALKKGQIVIALGNPYAIARDGEVSASWGIVSNLLRKAGPVPTANPNGGPATRPTLHHFGTLIQTDAKLNFGTSGGALVNLHGEMIGLTSSAAAAAGYEQAAGYAIPVDDTFRRVLAALKEGREVEYGFLGVSPQSSEDPRPAPAQGMRVGAVVSATPAFRAGLRGNDIITRVNNQPVHDADELFLLVGRLAAEAKVKLSILRNDKPLELEVTLSKYPIRENAIVTAPAPAWRGLRVEYVTAQPNFAEMHRNGKIPEEPGVVITEVAKDSPAAAAGLKPGEYLTQIENKPVDSPRVFYAAANKQSGPVALQLLVEKTTSDEFVSRIEFRHETTTVGVKK